MSPARLSSAREHFSQPVPIRLGAPPLGAKAVGSFVPKLTRKAFEKYGFSAATLITDWALIAGAEIAAFSAPERLKWPRLPGTYDEVAEGAEGRPGATLVLKVDPARALELEYGARQLIERINAYFGYRAVAELRIVQSPLSVERPPSRREPASPPVATAVKPPPGDPLADALARLEARVLGRAPA